MGILGMGLTERIGATRRGIKAMSAFAIIPPVIFPDLNQVDLLPGVLTYVSGPQAARHAVERKAPGIAEAPGKYLGQAAAPTP